MREDKCMGQKRRKKMDEKNKKKKDKEEDPQTRPQVQ